MSTTDLQVWVCECVNLLSVSRIYLSVLIQSELLSSNPAQTTQIKLNSTLLLYLHIHNICTDTILFSLCHSSFRGNDADVCVNCFILSQA